MSLDKRLSSILHALMHMAEHGGQMTSAELALHMKTNPVVVRRTMAGLREMGVVRSTKGHNGGWEIAADLSKVTLKDIHAAIGAPPVVASAVHFDKPTCLIEQAVNRQLNDTFAAAEAMVMERFGAITLAQLAEDFRKDFAAWHAHHKDHQHHA